MEQKGKILVIDDDAKLRRLFLEIFNTTGYFAIGAANGEEGLQLYQQEPIDLVILDLMLPDIAGLNVMGKIFQINPSQIIIIISGYSTIERAVEATKLGAYDFLEKPVEIERLLLTVKNAFERTQLLRERKLLITQPMHRYKMVGESSAIQKVYNVIDKVSATNSRILICGESGTGKDLVAQAIHYNSLRADKQFYRLNCAAIPEELIESELFGHSKGAFTHAISDKKGYFLLADQSTLFLDEIGDLSLRAQAKVLRAIEDGEVSPVGSGITYQVDVRIIAATNKNLESMIKTGDFREDLYHRINVVKIDMPPLRKRKEDISLLALHFLNESCKEHQLSSKRIAPEGLEILAEHNWKGNCRELKNFIARLSVLSETDVISPHTVSQILNIKDEAHEIINTDNFKTAKEKFEKRFIIRKLIKYGWNVSNTANGIGLERTTLHRKMKKYKIREDDVAS